MHALRYEGPLAFMCVCEASPEEARQVHLERQQPFVSACPGSLDLFEVTCLGQYQSVCHQAEDAH